MTKSLLEYVEALSSMDPEDLYVLYVYMDSTHDKLDSVDSIVELIWVLASHFVTGAPAPLRRLVSDSNKVKSYHSNMLPVSGSSCSFARDCINNKLDLYTILNIDETMDEKEITRAYKKLVLPFHPDKHKGDDSGFKMIGMARDLLINAYEGPIYYNWYRNNKYRVSLYPSSFQQFLDDVTESSDKWKDENSVKEQQEAERKKEDRRREEERILQERQKKNEEEEENRRRRAANRQRAQEEERQATQAEEERQRRAAQRAEDERNRAEMEKQLEEIRLLADKAIRIQEAVIAKERADAEQQKLEKELERAKERERVEAEARAEAERQNKIAEEERVKAQEIARVEAERLAELRWIEEEAMRIQQQTIDAERAEEEKRAEERRCEKLRLLEEERRTLHAAEEKRRRIAADLEMVEEERRRQEVRRMQELERHVRDSEAATERYESMKNEYKNMITMDLPHTKATKGTKRKTME
jgi:curved DNA-binding protein CbpA